MWGERLESNLFYLIFGVVMALLLAGVFTMQLRAQAEANVDMQAQVLVDDLARTVFTTFEREQPPFELPEDVGGSEYELVVDEERSAFIVRVLAGARAGSVYLAVANVRLRVENSAFSEGKMIYFLRFGDEVIVSASPIFPPPENVQRPTAAVPPEFYHFAKLNQRAAAAIVASYFHAFELGHDGVDVLGYTYEGENVLVQISRGGENLFGLRIAGHENSDLVGEVRTAWIVMDLTITENLRGAVPCPSIENAAASGWLLSPSHALSEFRSRAWRDWENNLITPENLKCFATAATTGLGTYPTWRFEFVSKSALIVVHYRMFYWATEEEEPGFVFQSRPELEPVG